MDWCFYLLSVSAPSVRAWCTRTCCIRAMAAFSVFGALISIGQGKQIISNDVTSDDVISDDVISDDVISDDVISDDVTSDDVGLC